MILTVSWRNIWRNKTRSLVIIAAVSLGIFAGVYTVAFMYGWVNQRIESVINNEVSHIQIHHPAYLESNEATDLIAGIPNIQKKILSLPEVKAVSVRVIANCMIASAESGSGIQLLGIDPENERLTTNIHDKIIEGDYFEGSSANQIIIGEKLAEKLNVKLRSRVVITLAELDGTLTGGAFRVAGIYRTSNTAFDEMKSFVKADKLRELLGIGNDSGHQIAILLNEHKLEDQVAGQLSSMIPGLDIMTWTRMMPEMQVLNEYMSLMMYVIVGIILLALGFGIVNTMLMVILERVKELGMLMAVGMNKIRLVSMIILESVLLSITGGVIGIALALVLTTVTGKTGIDLSLWAEGLHSMGYDAVVYPWIGLDAVAGVTIMVVLTGILSAIYPALKAIRLKPAEAIRIDM